MLPVLRGSLSQIIQRQDSSGISTLPTDHKMGIFLGILLFMATQGIFLGGTPGDLPVPMRIITPDEGALLRKSIPPEWSVPLLTSPPMRIIWTIITPQVLLTPVLNTLTKWGRSYKDSQSMPWIPRLHRGVSFPQLLWVLHLVIHHPLQRQHPALQS